MLSAPFRSARQLAARDPRQRKIGLSRSCSISTSRASAKYDGAL